MSTQKPAQDIAPKEAMEAINDLYQSFVIKTYVGKPQFSRSPINKLSKQEWAHFSYEITFERQGQRLETMWHCGADKEEEYGRVLPWQRYSSCAPIPKKEKVPKSSEVFAYICRDGVEAHAESFDDWASNLGYDTDSRTAEAIYRKCVDLYHSAVKLVGESAVRRFAELSSRL